MTPSSIPQLIVKGESTTLDPKRLTGELREAMQTRGAFANGQGGRVILGAQPSAAFVGQQVSERTVYPTRRLPLADPRGAHPDTAPPQKRKGPR